MHGSNFMSVDEILKCDHSNESYWEVRYFHVVLYILLYKVIQTFESLDEILKCDDRLYWAVLSYGTLYSAYKVVLSFECVKCNKRIK